MQPPGPITPGFYPGDGQASLLRANMQQYLLHNQANAAGTASIAVQLERIKSPHFYPFGVSLELWFSADPGVFEVDIQTADLDEDSHYVTLNTMNSGLNASFVGRVELPSFWAKYIRAKVVTVTNAANVSLLVTR